MRISFPSAAIAFLTGLLVVLSLQAQTNAEPRELHGVFHRTITVEERLDYLLFLPKGYHTNRAQGWPLMLFLHGSGECGTNLVLVKKEGPPKRAASDPEFPFVLVCPQFPDERLPRNSELLGLLDSVVASYNIDTNRIYLTGLSWGGYGTWCLGLAAPDRFAAIAPLCGGGERAWLVVADPTRRDALLRLPIWAFHGAKDPYVSLKEPVEMVEELKRMGSTNVLLTVYPEAGHDCWTDTYNDPEFYRWLLQHRRQP